MYWPDQGSQARQWSITGKRRLNSKKTNYIQHPCLNKPLPLHGKIPYEQQGRVQARRSSQGSSGDRPEGVRGWRTGGRRRRGSRSSRGGDMMRSGARWRGGAALEWSQGQEGSTPPGLCKEEMSRKSRSLWPVWEEFGEFSMSSHFQPPPLPSETGEVDDPWHYGHSYFPFLYLLNVM